MQLIYILLIGIVVYYLVTRLFENYSTQEDFDPSLVPVSSIVTLAKVAQKLVDGGGTLTNPGNLTITGNLQTNGNVFAANGSKSQVWIGQGYGPDIACIYAANNDLNIGSGPGIVNIRNNTTVNGNLNVTGEISGKCTNTQGGFSLGYGTWITANAPSSDDPYKLLFESSGNTVFRSKVGFQFRNEKDQRNIEINSQTSAVQFNGPLNVSGPTGSITASQIINANGGINLNDNAITSDSMHFPRISFEKPDLTSDWSIANQGYGKTTYSSANGNHIFYTNSCTVNSYNKGTINTTNSITLNSYGITIGKTTINEAQLIKLNEIISWYDTVKSKIYVKNGNTYIDMHGAKWENWNCHNRGAQDGNYNLGCGGLGTSPNG